MDPSLDPLIGLPNPGLSLPAAAGARPGATVATPTGGGFERLMGLQQRGRTLEAKLAQQASAADPKDPAHTARAKQQTFSASEFRSLRELVGPTPGGNARRALAAILERLEGGAALRSTDRARIRLAIAADEQRVDAAGAARVRAAVLSLDDALDTNSRAAQDPTLFDDPAHRAMFRTQNQRTQEQVRQLESLIDAGTFDARSIRGIFDARR